MSQNIFGCNIRTLIRAVRVAQWKNVSLSLESRAVGPVPRVTESERAPLFDSVSFSRDPASPYIALKIDQYCRSGSKPYVYSVIGLWTRRSISLVEPLGSATAPTTSGRLSDLDLLGEERYEVVCLRGRKCNRKSRGADQLIGTATLTRSAHIDWRSDVTMYYPASNPLGQD
jgi:hypothetical protein